MKTSFVSTYGMASALRQRIPQIQSELTKRSTEISTGRAADVGLALGQGTSRSLSLRHDYTMLNAHIDSNGLLQTKLKQTQLALQGMVDTGNSFLNALLSSNGTDGSAELVRQQAQAGISSFVDLANSVSNGHFLFSGINTSTQPIADYSGAPKLAIDTAFANAFGLSSTDPQADPAVANIDPAAMQAFLDGPFADLFDDPAWSTTWSMASDAPTTSRISPREEIATSTSANSPALRKLAMAFSMVADLGAENLPSATFDVIVSKSRELVGSAISELSQMQGGIGVAELRVSSATERLQIEKDAIATNISSLEGVDPAEAKVRFDTLSTQLEMTYALTTRILGLSIMNYA